MMTKNTTDNEKALQDQECIVAEQIASVDGYLTKADVDELARLRLLVGKSWDAVNGTWQPLAQDEPRTGTQRRRSPRRRRSHFGTRREAARGVGEMDCE